MGDALHARKVLDLVVVAVGDACGEADLTGLEHVDTGVLVLDEAEGDGVHVRALAPVVLVLLEADVLAALPLDELVRAGADGGVVVLVGLVSHVEVLDDVLGHDAEGEEALREVGGLLVVMADDGEVVRAVDGVDVVAAVGGLPLGGGHGLPGNLDVGGGDGLAVVPLQALAQVVGDVHGAVILHRDEAVLNRGHLLGELGHVHHVAIGDQEALDDHGLDIAQQVGGVDVHGVGLVVERDHEVVAGARGSSLAALAAFGLLAALRSGSIAATARSKQRCDAGEAGTLDETPSRKIVVQQCSSFLSCSALVLVGSAALSRLYGCRLVESD